MLQTIMCHKSRTMIQYHFPNEFPWLVIEWATHTL